MFPRAVGPEDCVHCGKEAVKNKFTCPQCRECFRVCGVECQRPFWKHHRPRCGGEKQECEISLANGEGCSLKVAQDLTVAALIGLALGELGKRQRPEFAQLAWREAGEEQSGFLDRKKKLRDLHKPAAGGGDINEATFEFLLLIQPLKVLSIEGYPAPVECACCGKLVEIPNDADMILERALKYAPGEEDSEDPITGASENHFELKRVDIVEQYQDIVENEGVLTGAEMPPARADTSRLTIEEAGIEVLRGDYHVLLMSQLTKKKTASLNRGF